MMRGLPVIAFLVFILSSCSESSDGYFNKVKLDEKGVLSWKVADEEVNTSFVVEEFRLEEWKAITEFAGKGEGKNDYSYNVDMSCGVYKLRVIAKDDAFHQSTVIENTMPELNFTPKKVDDYLKFTRKVNYEIFDQYGALALSGCDINVNTTSLKKGMYYLIYGNVSTEFLKKEVEYLGKKEL